MREIKFRAWNKKAKMFVSTFDLYSVGALNYEDGYDSENYELIQFTGLHDKNGKEIYESDLLLIPDTYKDRILDDGSGPVEPANHIAQVVFENNSFGVIIKERGEDFNTGYWSFERMVYEIGFTGIGEFEVIGNIYENLELLKAES